MNVENMDSHTLLLVIILVFNAGGFVWLSRNHFHTINKRLRGLSKRLSTLDDRLRRTEGVVVGIDRQLSSVVKFIMKESSLEGK